MQFGTYFDQALTKAGMSQRDFARQVKIHQQAISEVVLGKRKPPLRHMTTWAAALQEHIDPALFQELAELEHCPPGIQKLVAELRAKDQG